MNSDDKNKKSISVWDFLFDWPEPYDEELNYGATLASPMGYMPNLRIGWFWLAAMLLAATLVAYVVFVTVAWIFRATGHSWQWIGTGFGSFVATLVLALISMGLYALRDRKRLFYGLTEFGVAFVSGREAIMVILDKGLAAWVVVAAAAYVMVGGLDNIYKGLERRGRSVRPDAPTDSQ